MTCPKCEEGKIKKILFKKDNRIGFLCDFCGAVWIEGENIKLTSGHVIESLKKDDEMEYTFVDIDKEDEESKSVKL